VENESIEYLKAHGAEVRFDALILGPFEFGSNSCPLIIPFTLNSGNLEKLFFASDGAAKSTPLQINCPTGMVFRCTDRVTYPQISYNGCGPITVTFDPPLPAAGSFPPGYFPVGVSPIKVTVADSTNDTVSCMFNLTIIDDTPPVRPTLPDVTFSGCSGNGYTPAAPPTTTDSCMGTVTGTTTTVFPIKTLGTNVVTWTFDDGNGNKTNATQRVIITGLTFTGFYSPIAGINGTCQAPVRTINQGSVNPIKFDIFCGGTAVTAGTPPVVKIQAYSSNCTPGAELVVVNAVYQNDWHYNWDTTGWAKGVYKVTVVLPDGTQQFVFVRIK
jgi:hypothetical protein